MLRRGALLLFLLSSIAVPAAAQPFHRGEVVFQTEGDSSINAWWFTPGPWTCCATPAGGAILIDKLVPYVGPGHLISPSSNVILFHDRHTVSWWDGIPQYFELPGKGYNDIFTDDAELTEFALLRSGHFLVAETPNDRGARLIEFDLNGRIAEQAFGGARHIELLADQCTLLYSNDDPRVRRFNICTHQQETDFVTLLPDENAGAIRQLPDGDVLVAAGHAVLDFRADGSFWMLYPIAGVTHIALTPDGQSFWAAAAQIGKPVLEHFDPVAATEQPIEIGNPEMRPPASATAITDLMVAGEWRASMVPARSRGARRR